MQKLKVPKMRAFGHAASWTVEESICPFDTEPKIMVIALFIIQEQTRRIVIPYQTSKEFPLFRFESLVYCVRWKFQIRINERCNRDAFMDWLFIDDGTERIPEPDFVLRFQIGLYFQGKVAWLGAFAVSVTIGGC